MKIRTGFVSNSSSSSFVLFVTKELHERLKAILHPYVIAVVEAMGGEENVFGIQARSFSEWSGAGGEGTFEFIEVNYDGEIPMYKSKYSERESKMTLCEAFETYQEAIKEEGRENETFSHSEDW